LAEAAAGAPGAAHVRPPRPRLLARLPPRPHRQLAAAGGGVRELAAGSAPDGEPRRPARLLDPAGDPVARRGPALARRTTPRRGGGSAEFSATFPTYGPLGATSQESSANSSPAPLPRKRGRPGQPPLRRKSFTPAHRAGTRRPPGARTV